MQYLIDVKNRKDQKFVEDLINRLRLKVSKISLDDVEDIGLGIAIEEGLKTRNISTKRFMKNLQNKINGK